MDAIDHLTATELSKNNPELYWLYAYMTASFRQGHLYVETENCLLPNPKELFADEPNLVEIEASIQIGLQRFEESAFVCKAGSRLYLKRAYECQENIEKELQRLLQAATSPIEVPQEYAAKLFPEQLHAVKEALQHRLFCIAGGPGTGKTHTAGLLLKIFLERHGLAFCKVALVGPTGKAAANLEKSILRAIGSETQASLEVKTLHALLHRGEGLLNYHFIIVDESSMIDAVLLQKFLSRVGRETCVLFLGDPDQLPSVEAGDVFYTLLDRLPHARLTQCQRTDQAAIIELAGLVNRGKADEVMQHLQQKNGVTSFQDVSINEPLPASYAILSPKKSGPWGVHAINRHFLAQNPTTFPIIITKNDYVLDLMNGEIGKMENKKAIFHERTIPSILLAHFEPAFALSVHKSQGSEFDRVLLLMPPGSEVFGRRMLYTAITRAKKEIMIWGSEATLRATIENSGRRHS